MIKGLTHDPETGVANKTMKYKGKISTGFAPSEPPNTKSYPVPAGFFRILREVTITEKIGMKGEQVAIKKWKLNEKVQKALEATINSPTPRKLDFLCLYKTPEMLWESYLAKYSSTEGLLCRSYGEGENARCLNFDGGERKWIDREFDGKKGCPYKECPDYKSGSCKESGIMKVFPLVDLSTQPYRFETRSINTIIGIESALDDMWNLLKAAHIVKMHEAGTALQFDGLFGAKLSLIHRKTKSGGRDVYITDLVPTEEFSKSLMVPIERGIELNQAAALTDGKTINFLGVDFKEAENATLALPSADMDTADEKEMAEQFHADADKAPENNDKLYDDAAKSMLSESE